MQESLKHELYLDPQFDLQPQKWCSDFLSIVVGFIFSHHGPFRLWNAVFIEALTVMKMTAVWSHTVCASTFLIREHCLSGTLWLTLTRTKTVEMYSLTSISSNALINFQRLCEASYRDIMLELWRKPCKTLRWKQQRSSLSAAWGLVVKSPPPSRRTAKLSVILQ